MQQMSQVLKEREIGIKNNNNHIFFYIFIYIYILVVGRYRR